MSARDDPDEAYKMGYADGEGDAKAAFADFLDEIMDLDWYIWMPPHIRAKAEALRPDLYP